MSRKAKGTARRPAPRRGVLDWEQFHFLENLTLHCAVPRSVPAESGVCFYISAEGFRADGACVLFRIDRPKDPLVLPDTERRPDYLAAFVRGGTLWLTVIEMKGRTEKGLTGGIEQIENLVQRLREEFQRCVSTKLKVRYQGILLSPPNSQLPVFKLNGLFNTLPIAALQSPQKFNLGPYVVGPNPRGTRYNRVRAEKERNDAAKVCPAEHLFLEQGRPERCRDRFCQERVSTGKDRACYHANFADEASGTYVALFSEPGEPRGLVVSPQAREERFIAGLFAEAARLGLRGALEFRRTAPGA